VSELAKSLPAVASTTTDLLNEIITMAIYEPTDWHVTIIACGGKFWFVRAYTGPEWVRFIWIKET
jgi:hypothetical protein